MLRMTNEILKPKWIHCIGKNAWLNRCVKLRACVFHTQLKNILHVRTEKWKMKSNFCKNEIINVSNRLSTEVEIFGRRMFKSQLWSLVPVLCIREIMLFYFASKGECMVQCKSLILTLALHCTLWFGCYAIDLQHVNLLVTNHLRTNHVKYACIL